MTVDHSFRRSDGREQTRAYALADDLRARPRGPRDVPRGRRRAFVGGLPRRRAPPPPRRPRPTRGFEGRWGAGSGWAASRRRRPRRRVRGQRRRRRVQGCVPELHLHDPRLRARRRDVHHRRHHGHAAPEGHHLRGRHRRARGHDRPLHRARAHRPEPHLPGRRQQVRLRPLHLLRMPPALHRVAGGPEREHPRGDARGGDQARGGAGVGTDDGTRATSLRAGVHAHLPRGVRTHLPRGVGGQEPDHHHRARRAQEPVRGRRRRYDRPRFLHGARRRRR